MARQILLFFKRILLHTCLSIRVYILIESKKANVQGILRINQHLCLAFENLHTCDKIHYWPLTGERS